MRQQRVDQRTVEIACRGMHDQTRRFVDHDQVCVFVYDDKRYFLRLWFGRSGRRDRNRENLARFDPLVGVSYRLARQA
jgi:hypothetical protein